MTSFLGLVMILAFFFWVIILLLLTRRLFQSWYEIREESFLHLMFIAIYPAFMFAALASYYIILTLITPGEDIKIPTLLGSAFTYGFYLEFSLFYLSLFNNSRHYFEKYIPVLFGFSLLLSIVEIIINEKLYSGDLFDNTLFFITLIIMSYLCVRIYINLRSNNQYFDDQERKFIILMEKITIIFLFICICDGLLHIIMSVQTIYFNEVYMIIAIISLGISGLIFLYCKKLVEEHARCIDWLAFFNNIS
ncbi:MAG: hypothetical protein ACFE9L_16035 [Candidatus Hodarchaeota archaeon]